LSGERPGLLAGKPTQNDQYYIISASDAENLTKKIKKLQTELWNLEVKHQQLQESNAQKASSMPKEEHKGDVEALKDALRKEKEVNVMLVNRQKDITDFFMDLREDLKSAVESSPNDPILVAVQVCLPQLLSVAFSMLKYGFLSLIGYCKESARAK